MFVRTPSDRIFGALMLALVLLVFGPALAGEAEWKAHLDAGMSAYLAGDYRVAAARLEAALREAESFGQSDQRFARSLNSVALLYQAQGRLVEAELLAQRALWIYEKALGPDHPNVGTALNNLARLYQLQGRLAEAEPLYLRDLAILIKIFGPNHLSVADSLNNLAVLYQTQGRLTDAEQLYLLSLTITEKALGSDTATSRSPRTD